MISNTIAEVKGLKVLWIGMTKPQLIKEGLKAGTYTEVKPSIQLSRKNDEGQVVTFYANSKDPFPATLKVDEIIDMEMKIRAFKDNLYFDVIKINQNGNGKGIKI